MYNFFCFHGRGQTSISFRYILSNLERELNYCNFHYLQGPFLYQKGYSWYSDDIEKKNVANIFSNFKNIQNKILFGFSEGGSFAFDLLQYSKDDNIKAIISISPPFKEKRYEQKIDIPGLLIVSKKDSKVKYIESEKYLINFPKLKTIYIDEDHKIYINEFIKNSIKELL